MDRKSGSKDRKNKKDEELSREPISNVSENGNQSPFEEAESLDNNKVFIECPGATVYDSQTREIKAGVEFIDEGDPSAGYRIIDQPVYAPDHKKRRLIRKEHRKLIRRCQACQDLTVRLIRREGPDFFIPSPKHPRKKQLKPVEKNW